VHAIVGDQNEDQFTNVSSLLYALARLHKGMANSSALTKARKDTFDRHLLSSIDLLVYAELTIIYLYEYVAPLAFKTKVIKELSWESPGYSMGIYAN
jgi:hypothetical protein